VFAYLSTQRARRAEALAQETRATAETGARPGRTLLGYLAEILTVNWRVSPFGVLAEFSQRQIDYFHGPARRSRATRLRQRCVGVVHHARAMRTLGSLTLALPCSRSPASVEEQRAAGDHSEATTIALALRLRHQWRILDNKSDPAGPAASNHASELLQPARGGPRCVGGSATSLRGGVLSRLGTSSKRAISWKTPFSRTEIDPHRYGAGSARSD